MLTLVDFYIFCLNAETVTIAKCQYPITSRATPATTGIGSEKYIQPKGNSKYEQE
jgi:hypothetical protein